MMEKDCLFCKIIRKEIPSHKVYEDESTYCFLDISPVNEGHILVVPKHHSKDFLDMEDTDVSNAFNTARDMGKMMIENLGAKGFNLMMNTKPAAGQVIMHSHIHVIPRFENDNLKLWPGKQYSKGRAEEILSRLKGNI